MAKVFKPVTGKSIAVTAGATSASTTITALPSKVNALLINNTSANPAYLNVGYNPNAAVTASVTDIYIPASVVNFIVPINTGADKIATVRIGSSDATLHIGFGMLEEINL